MNLAVDFLLTKRDSSLGEASPRLFSREVERLAQVNDRDLFLVETDVIDQSVGLVPRLAPAQCTELLLDKKSANIRYLPNQ